ncbi:TPA: helix-turn-helix transcriptional regulator [Stenotrophomonas maltophilia]|jgi:prophage regulatory protein|uniref:helix-turn-helix transcriptional regulator n=1 Tax=Stenotrophomonas maltophilia TaxID=40324 RepID=UPI0013D914AB|nr:AlpA family phage regulatory protein [Stenotrophomonas maltophilia]
MTVNRAARLQFAIHELIDILAEDITARVVTGITKQESSRQQPAPAQKAEAPYTPPRPRRLLRRAEVEERTSLPKTTLYDWIKSGQFPPPIRLGDAMVAWLESDIEEWIDRQIG